MVQFQQTVDWLESKPQYDFIVSFMQVLSHGMILTLDLQIFHISRFWALHEAEPLNNTRLSNINYSVKKWLLLIKAIKT